MTAAVAPQATATDSRSTGSRVGAISPDTRAQAREKRGPLNGGHNPVGSARRVVGGRGRGAGGLAEQVLVRGREEGGLVAGVLGRLVDGVAEQLIGHGDCEIPFERG